MPINPKILAAISGGIAAYLGDEEYEKAHTQSDRPPPRVDWKALDYSRRTRRAAATDAWRRIAGKLFGDNQ